MVSKSDSGTFSTMNANIGSETKTLTTSNLPSHTHTYAKVNTPTGQATGNTGSTTLTINQIPSHTHGYKSTKDTGSTNIYGLIFDTANNRWTAYANQSLTSESTGGGEGHTHTLNSHTHTIGTTSTNSGSTGSGTALSVVQNSKVCIRWHRIA